MEDGGCDVLLIAEVGSVAIQVVGDVRWMTRGLESCWLANTLTSKGAIFPLGQTPFSQPAMAPTTSPNSFTCSLDARPLVLGLRRCHADPMTSKCRSRCHDRCKRKEEEEE